MNPCKTCAERGRESAGDKLIDGEWMCRACWNPGPGEAIKQKWEADIASRKLRKMGWYGEKLA